MIKVGIIGATGYTGAELVRILSRHPQVELAALTTQSYAGKSFWEVYPHLNKFVHLTCTELRLSELVAGSDVILTALPHGHAMPVAKETMRQGKILIDLGADFRLTDPFIYEEWYKVEHTAKDLLWQAVYGLPEINREKIKGAWLVANPGCYPTSAILALAPLLKDELVEPESIIIDSKSGVSGAGRSLSPGTHFCEVNENFRAYNVAAHRHTPEIEQELSRLTGREPVVISFTTHLLPVTRGILSTVYGKLKKSLNTDDILEIYREFYRSEYFVRVLPAGMYPQLKWVAGTNFCDIGVAADHRTGRVVIISVIDNLIKGASGQAVQNINIICGFPEATALEGPGVYP